MSDSQMTEVGSRCLVKPFYIDLINFLNICLQCLNVEYQLVLFRYDKIHH